MNPTLQELSATAPASLKAPTIIGALPPRNHKNVVNTDIKEQHLPLIVVPLVEMTNFSKRIFINAEQL